MPGPLLGALHTRPTLFFKMIDWSRYKENLCFYDDIERLRNLTNIQLGIGSRNCILVHDETLGGRVNVRINKWLCKGDEVKPMNEHNQPSIPDWKENSLLHSDVKKTGQNLQFKCNPKVYHVKTFMWKKSPACSLFSTEWTFPRMLGIGHSARWWKRMQHLGVTDSDVQISTIWAGPNHHPFSYENYTLLLETARASETWAQERCEHSVEDDLQCVPWLSQST